MYSFLNAILLCRIGGHRVIWVIGSKGMLGRELTNFLDRTGIAWVGSDRECDIRDTTALSSFASGKTIHWMINCAAYTAVDKAEEEEEAARSINATGAANIAELASRMGVKLIHLSTDYVFDGTNHRPYREDDAVNPICAYGRTKAEGEALVAARCAKSFIIRTSWLYGKHGPNFVCTMLRLMRGRESVSVVNDQKGCPTWSRDLAAAIAAICNSETERYGVYHFTDCGESTWYDFACAIRYIGRELAVIDHDVVVRPISTAAFATKAIRPAYSVLSKDLIRAQLGIEPPEWKTSLRKFLSEEGTI
jgi:dTDP-4-dehydrorhamnose reductase